MVTRRSFIKQQAGFAAAMALGTAAADAQVISQPSRLVVGFPAGGAADTIARLLVDQLKTYAPRLIVDNKPGAGGRIAIEAVKSSAADGTTMILTPASMMVLYPHVYKSLPYDPVKDFVAVSTVCTGACVLAVGPKVPASVKTLSDLLQWCKAHPKDASYGTPGGGSIPHLVADNLWRTAGAQVVHVPYKGGAPLVQDAMGGHLPIAMAVMSSALSQIQSGHLRAIAVTGKARSSHLPDTPTLVEAGYTDVVADEWYGVFVPANTPAPVVTALNAAIQEAVKTRSVLDGLANFAFAASSNSAQDFAALLKSDIDRWGPIVKASGFTPEN